MADSTVGYGATVESVLRVPPLFLLDKICMSGIASTIQFWGSDNLVAVQNLSRSNVTTDGHSLIFSSLELSLTFIGCLFTSFAVVLNAKDLISVYSYLVSVAMLYFSYQRNTLFLNRLEAMETHFRTHPGDNSAFYSMGIALAQTVVLQCGFGYVYQYLNSLVLKHNWLSKAVLISFLSPSILSLLPFPRQLLEIVKFSSLLLLAISSYILRSNLSPISRYIAEGRRFYRLLRANSGLIALGLLVVRWSKLHLTAAFRIFWIIRLLFYTTAYIVENGFSKQEALNGTVLFSSFSESAPLLLPAFVQLGESLLISGCETFIAVVGMASVISFIFEQIGYFLQNFLLIEDRHKHFGIISSVVFCTLALKTSLTTLSPENRLLWLNRCFCLLFILLLRMTQMILNPMLVSLSILHNFELHKHLRAFVVSTFLVIYPAWLIVYLWRCQPVSPWLLGISVYCLKVFVNMVITLATYFLFLVDFYRKTFWERLDDYYYYICSLGSTMEFCFGIFLLFNGCWELFHKSGGIVRALVLCLYAYFNIWFVAKAGWSTFMQRRMAVKKIDKLHDATAEELASLEDVCAICYHQMENAKFTPCKHYFHAICLRKWLYMQDFCPICRNKLCL